MSTEAHAAAAWMIKDLVSTIIPVHNRPQMLRAAVTSVTRQSYRPIEIVIVDDGSTDDTAQVADALAAADPTVHVVHQHNGGPGLAREAGRRRAQGEFIQYLDSDDVLLPRKFESQVSILRANPGCGIAYGPTRFCGPGAAAGSGPWKRTGERIEWMFPSFLQSRWWGTSTPLYRRALTDAAGPWLGLSSEEDWEYDCRLAASGVRLAYVDEFVSEEHDHGGPRLSDGGSISVDKLRDRAKAHVLILEHAVRAGIVETSVEMQHFARELFLLARQCGAAGLAAESRELFLLARRASGAARARGLDFRLYKIAATVLGWSLVGRLACASDEFRR
jgi:glycosyltransferase involved in cell wall biosynthesis